MLALMAKVMVGTSIRFFVISRWTSRQWRDVFSDEHSLIFTNRTPRFDLHRAGHRSSQVLPTLARLNNTSSTHYTLIRQNSLQTMQLFTVKR